MLSRHTDNPLLSPSDITPSRVGFEVIGAFNAGVARCGDEVIMLIRVAERPQNPDAGSVVCPYIGSDGMIHLKIVPTNDPHFDMTDSRMVVHRETGELFLTSISHLRLARSRDGVHFSVDDRVWMQGQSPYESYGIEDARITWIDDQYYVNYTAVSSHGIATGLAVTRDFVDVDRCGIIFPPANRDVTLFPEKINGMYWCYHRPMPGMFGAMNIWAASSPDLIHWGEHRIVLEASSDGWEGGRVGGGAPPLWTERGWLSIYHAADKQDRYCLGAFLTSHGDPCKVIARSQNPILTPHASYELDGFFGQVVFTCGALIDGDRLRIYYGAADEIMALAEADISEILNSLTPV